MAIALAGHLFEYLGLAKFDRKSPLGWRPTQQMMELIELKGERSAKYPGKHREEAEEYNLAFVLTLLEDEVFGRDRQRGATRRRSEDSNHSEGGSPAAQGGAATGGGSSAQWTRMATAAKAAATPRRWRPADQVIKGIRRATRRHFSAEDKIADRAGATETALMCRVSDDGPSRCERLALGPSSESLQGRNPREVGHGAAARTMGISKGRSKMLGSMKCVMDRR